MDCNESVLRDSMGGRGDGRGEGARGNKEQVIKFWWQSGSPC